MEYFLLILGHLIGGFVLVHSLWYLINTQRRKIRNHVRIYIRRSNICLASSGLILSSLFLYGLVNNLYIVGWRLLFIDIGLLCLGLSMYFTENEVNEEKL